MSDYVQMWKDLGMDLENHDLLCQVLPTAVGDVFLSQENRPKAMDFWDLVISEVHGIRPAELIEAQKHPEQYRDLIVRVAGYSAFFNVLSKKTQDDIIGRTEQSL